MKTFQENWYIFTDSPERDISKLNHHFIAQFSILYDIGLCLISSPFHLIKIYCINTLHMLDTVADRIELDREPRGKQGKYYTLL